MGHGLGTLSCRSCLGSPDAANGSRERAPDDRLREIREPIRDVAVLDFALDPGSRANAA
jgi:hypothetical protein